MSSKTIRAVVIAAAAMALFGCSSESNAGKPEARQAAPAHPQVATAPKVPDAMDLERCKIAEDAATSIMTARQRGIAMSKVMEIASEPETKAMVVRAYEIPRYQTAKHVDREVSDFASAAYLSCIKAVQG